MKVEPGDPSKDGDSNDCEMPVTGVEGRSTQPATIYLSDDSDVEGDEEDDIVVLTGDCIPKHMRKSTNTSQPILIHDETNITEDMPKESVNTTFDPQITKGSNIVPRRSIFQDKGAKQWTPRQSSLDGSTNSSSSSETAQVRRSLLQQSCGNDNQEQPTLRTSGHGHAAAQLETKPELSGAERLISITNPGEEPKSSDPEFYDDSLKRFFTAASQSFKKDQTVEEASKALEIVAPHLASALNIKLMDHQILGVSWMIQMEKNPMFKGGLLCDAMGLGKTIQTIATIIGNKSQDPTTKATLVVVPPAVLEQWKREITKITSSPLKVLIYHGSSRLKYARRLRRCDVVITTYGTLTSECPKTKNDSSSASSSTSPQVKTEIGIQNDDSDDSDDDLSEPELVFRFQCQSEIADAGDPLFETSWYRVILDEAHIIRNRKTRVCEAACKLDSVLRWCISGTIIYNDVDDIYSHLRFTGISPYQDVERFRTMITKVHSKNPELALKRAQAILQTCMLQRDKNSVLNGKKLITLPPRSVITIELEFSSPERKVYDLTEEKMRVCLNRYMREGKLVERKTHVFAMLTRLRQLCDHPWLLRKDPTDPIHHLDDFEIPHRDLFTTIEEKTVFDAPAEDDSDSDDQDKGHGSEDDDSDGDEVELQSVDGSEMYGLPDPRNKRRATDPPDAEVDVKKLRVDVVPTKKIPRYAENPYKDLKSILPSTKLRYIKQRLEEWLKEPHTRILIFSQFVKTINLLSSFLDMHNIKHVKYIGFMGQKVRADTIETFSRPQALGPRVLLVSMTCGGVGLNLTAASKVILVDPAWNPAAQAIDRAHRIGQFYPVEVIRLTIRETKEQRVHEIQEDKDRSTKIIMGVERGKHLKNLSLVDVLKMFGCDEELIKGVEEEA